MKHIIEGILKIDSMEDNGQAMICESLPIQPHSSEDENGTFVTIQSWDNNKRHTDLIALTGSKIRITIETID